MVLNFHYYLSDENILNLGLRTDAVLARYQQGEEHATLLLVKYGLPLAEVARQLGVTTGAVSNCLKRAEKKLV